MTVQGQDHNQGAGQNESSQCFTVYRRTRKIQEHLPKSPRTCASVIMNIIQKVSPRKKKELEKRGVRRSLEDAFIVDSLRAQISSLRQNKMTKIKRRQYRTLLQAACTTKYRLNRKTAKSLGFGSKVLRKKTNERKGRKDLIPETTRSKVQAFWKSDGISREVPLKKRVQKGQPPFLLECSYIAAYKRYRSSHPDLKIGYCKFITNKPRNVMHMKLLERIVCCCIRCENIKLKVRAINNELLKMGQHELRIEVDDLLKKTLCPPINGQLSMSCLRRQCTHCGVQAIKEYYRPDTMATAGQSSSTVKYDQWKTVNIEISVKQKGANESLVKRTVRRLKRVTCIAEGVDEILNFLMDDMKEYSIHKFRADWQKQQFDAIKSNMPPQSAIVVMDFAMNYTCFLQDEVQSYHWSPPQVTIHPCYTYVNTSTEFSAPTHTEAIICISSDPQHDANAVAAFLVLCSQKMISTAARQQYIFTIPKGVKIV